MEKEPVFLLIDTSTDICSVAVATPTKTLATRETAEHHAHASKLAVFIREILEDTGIPLQEFAAVAVSKGPGSYTGLRVGVSTAKGICYGKQLPLIAVGSLNMLAHRFLQLRPKIDGHSYIIPMIDARRMEVYTAVFSEKAERLSPVKAKIIDADSFAGALEDGPVYFIGDGSDKCRTVLVHPNARFISVRAHALGMLPSAYKKWRENQTEDVAYFTPFYLKNFVANVSNKPLSKF